MKYARKIALRSDLDGEYQPIIRPPVPIKKGALSLQIGKILNKRKKNDQEKVKGYINVLHRYINVSDKIPSLSEIRTNAKNNSSI